MTINVGLLILFGACILFAGMWLGAEIQRNAKSENEPSPIGPQVSCEITNGEVVSLTALGRPVNFVPCIDGWYRCHVRDLNLHHMLCAGAAGYDAGLYWKLDEQQGVWGIPAPFIGMLQARLDALTKASGWKSPPVKNSEMA